MTQQQAESSQQAEKKNGFSEDLRQALGFGLFCLVMAFIFEWQPSRLFIGLQDGTWVFPYGGIHYLLYILAFILCAIAFPHLRGLWRLFLKIPARLWVGFVTLATFVSGVYIAYGPMESLPHTPDSIAYLWTARTFASGHLWVESHDLAEFFHQMFFINDGRWYSLFQPGWPVLLSLGVLAGIPFVINPLVGAMQVPLVYAIGKRLLGEKEARLALLFFVVSSLQMSMPAMVLSHPLSCLLLLLALYATLRLLEDGRFVWTLLLGVSIGLCFNVRAMNAATTGFTVASILLVPLFKGRVKIHRLAVALLIVVALSSLQFVYNHVMTGDAMTWPQDRYFDMTEPKESCHRPGFGTSVGCPNIHPDNHFPNGFGFFDAVDVFHFRINTYLGTLFGWPAFFFLAGLPFLLRRKGRGKWVLFGVIFWLVAGYFTFYFHGLMGRYYYEMGFAVLLLMAAGILDLSKRIDSLTKGAQGLAGRMSRAIVPSLGIMFVSFNLFFFLPEVFSTLGNRFFGVDASLRKEGLGIETPAVVHVPAFYAIGFALMTPTPPWPVVYVRDLGPISNRLMRQYYPDRHIYRFDLDRWEMIEEKDRPSRSTVRLEFETEIPPSKIHHGYAFRGADPSVREPLVNGPRRSLMLQSRAPDAWMEVEQYIFEDGLYNVRLAYDRGPGHGIWSVTVDGQPLFPSVDGYMEVEAGSPMKIQTKTPIRLDRKRHTLRIQSIGKNPVSKGYDIAVDWIEFTRIDKENGP